MNLRARIEEAYGDGREALTHDVKWKSYGFEPRYFDVHVAPLRDGRRIVGAQVTLTDVTERPSMRRDLRHANQQVETACAELQATGEELETTNEELEAALEQLEAANEELASTNELLHESNDELTERDERLREANERLCALVASLGATLDLAALPTDLALAIRSVVEGKKKKEEEEEEEPKDASSTTIDGFRTSLPSLGVTADEQNKSNGERG
jgi:chromosome segregation ATPase